MGAVERISVPGTMAGVSEASEAFERFGDAHGIPKQGCWRFLVALDEILSNIVRHGYADAPGGIDLTFRVDHGSAVVEVADNASPYNPLLQAAPDTAAPLEARTPGGLGVMLVQSLMDHVSYERRDNRNHLILAWKLTHADQ